MEDLFDKEWLLTNGLGSFSCGTVSGANTRRYHGLLTAALNPPTDRRVMVAKIEERIYVEGTYHDLSCNQYPDVVHPTGTKYLNSFDVVPFPTWYYGMNTWQLEKSISMVTDSNTTLIKYINKGKNPFVLELHPLYDDSDFHSTFHKNAYTDFYSEILGSHIKTYAHYGSKPIFTSWSVGEFFEARAWYRNIVLLKERERNLDFLCDYYRIGYLRHELKPNEEMILCFTLEEGHQKDMVDFWPTENKESNGSNEIQRQNFYKDLLRSGKQFLVRRTSTQTMSIIAGYPWFADWGRDTMIAMRGLTIATGNKLASKSILSTFFCSIDQGMIPNRFPDNSEDVVPYNAMDATLWLFIATYEYYTKFNDFAFIKRHMNVLKWILDCHIEGTRFNIHVTEEGFLYGGEKGQQLTWMDAKVNDSVITPRQGCPVEINALWYNALKIYEKFCKDFDMMFGSKYKEIITQFETNFSRMFTNSEGTLFDVIVPNGPKDDSFRPNQLFCLSLPFNILQTKQQKVIFEAVRDMLFTPYGLRTLNQANPDYKGEYSGDPLQRDTAYHQGTVWPYLLYEYYHSFFKLYGANLKNKKKVVEELTSLKDHFYNHQGLHCISEIFDGDAPEKGKGCIQQAWSIAAVIQIYTEYNLFELDRHEKTV